MEEIQTQQNSVVAQAMKLFMRYGIKSVSMDDISRELGISKKTLYQSVEDKNDLVHKTVQLYFKMDKEFCAHILNKQENPIDMMLGLMKHAANSMHEVNPSLIFDLQKYYPKSWKLFKDYRINVIQEEIRQNLINGTELDWYRADLDPDIISRLYVHMIDGIVNPDVFDPTRFKHSEVVAEALLYHLSAVVSDKGRAYLLENKTNEPKSLNKL